MARLRSPRFPLRAPSALVEFVPDAALLAAVALTGALVLGPPASAEDSVPAPHGPGAVGEPLEAGANSFTEAQVRERFDRMGFGDVTDLAKDERGVWVGTAVHAGKSVRIGMDYRGHVAAQ